VRWKGYRREYDTWEAAVNLENVAKVIQDYHDQSPDTPASGMKARAVAFQAFNRHLCLFFPLAGSAGEGFMLPD
jgi:hypothetical protein